MNTGCAGDFDKTLETAVECGFGDKFVTLLPFSGEGMRVGLSSVRVEEPRDTILDGSRAACSSSYESGSCRTREHSALAQGERQRRSVTPRRTRVSVDRTTGFDNRRHHCKREKPNSAGLLPAKRPLQSPTMQREVHRSTGIDVPG
jgi:hypothetical protein